MIYRWTTPPHRPKERVLDSDSGRYLVRRDGPYSREFAVLHNNRATTFTAPSLEQAMRLVENLLNGRMQSKP